MKIEFQLDGIYEQTINDMIKSGIAKTKEEAIVIAILEYAKNNEIK